MNYLWFKRFFDIVLSAIAIIILLPFLIIFGLLIKLDSRGPIFFTQERIGRFGDPFKIIKFRTMQVDTPEVSTEELGDSNNYVTKYGHFLRKFGIDELPQLFNVLKGDMSLIGPRPVIASEKKLNRLRMKNGSLAIRPGMSGLAQVNGRDAVTIAKKASYDGTYAQTMSLIIDIQIFFLTIITVITHDGYKEGKIIKKIPSSRLYNRIQRRLKITSKKKEQQQKKIQREQKKATNQTDIPNENSATENK
jgi:O-antigen biosynthesis protein WbqP